MGMLDSVPTAIAITAKDATGPAFASVERGLRSIASQATALGGALGAAAFGTMLKSAIDAADQVNKLAAQTGIAAAEIDRLTVVAKLNDVEASGLVKSYKALATAMNEATVPASQQAKAFEALGIKVTNADGSLRSLQEMTKDLARVFAGAKDGPEKMAVAVGLLGKNGVEMIPVLNNMAEDMERAARVQQAFGEINKETAANGDTFNDAMTLLGEGLRRMFLPAVDALGPAMNRFAEAMINVNKNGSALQPVLSIVFEKILPAAVETVGALIIAGNALARSLGNLLGGLAASLVQLASGNFGQAWATAKAAFGDSGDIIRQSNVEIAALMDRTKAATPAVAGFADTSNRMGKAAAALAAPVKKAADAFKDFHDAIMRAYNDALAWEIAGQEIEKQQQAVATAVADGATAMAVYIDQQHSAVDAYNAQTAAIGKTADELAVLEVARQAEIRDLRLMAGWGQEAIDIYNRWVEAIASRRGVEAIREQAEAFKRLAENIRDDLTDSFLRAVESGRDFFKSLTNDLKRMFSQLVLRPIVQGVMAPLAGGITSALYGGGAGAQGLGGGGDIGSYVSAGKSLYGLGDTSASWGSAASGFALSGTGEALGLSTTVFDSAAGASAALTVGGEALTALAAAAPYIAAVVAIAYAAYQAFGQEPGGPKLGGYAFAGSGMTPWNRTDQFTNGGFQPGHFTPDQMDAALQPIATEWVKAIGATVTALGGTAGVYGYDLGIDKDPNGQAANRLGIRAAVNGKQVYDYWSGDSLGRDDQTLQDRLQLESKRAVIAALQASDLPAQIAAVFDTMTAATATSAEVDNVMAFAAAMKSIIDTIGGNVAEDAAAAWAKSQRSSVEVLTDMAAEVVRLAGAMDGSTSSMQALAAATGDYRSAVLQTLVAIKQISAQVEAMFGATRNSLETFGLSPEALYDRYRKDADAAMVELATATDPESVAKLAERINADINAAFGVIGDDSKALQQQPLLDYLNGVDAVVQSKLATLSASISSSTTDPFTAASDALAKAADLFQKPADTQANAASKIEIAAAKLSAAVDKFVAQLPLQVEATVVDHLV